MRRQIIFKAASDIEAPAGYRDPGSSIYPGTNTPEKALYQIWNNPIATPQLFEYAYCWPQTGSLHCVGFERPPTLVTFEKVTIEAGIDYSQQGPNNWWFPPNNEHGPGGAIVIRMRDGVNWLTGSGTASKLFTDSEDNSCNVNSEPGIFKLYPLVWEMASHPEGGVWTLEDLMHFAAGIQFHWSNGPNGQAYDPVAGSLFKIRVPYLRVTLDVNDYGGYSENQRRHTAMALRMFRGPRDEIRPKGLLQHMPAGLGQIALMSHPRGPSAALCGWGPRRLERRAGLVLQRTYHPESFMVEDNAFDLQAYRCLWWGSYRTDFAWSPELQGIALLEKGAGFTHDRAQDAWIKRPGDGVLMRVPEDLPVVCEDGLALYAAGDIEKCLYNTDWTHTPWEIYAVDEAAVTSDDTIIVAQEQGYLVSTKFEFTGAGGAASVSQLLGTFPRSSGHYLNVRVGVQNTAVQNPATQCMEWSLFRFDGALTEYWNATTRVWAATPARNPIPSDEPYGESISASIPCDCAGAVADPNYRIEIGRLSSTITGCVFHGGIANVQHSSTARPGVRGPLVTLGSTITRVADQHSFPSTTTNELWSTERGVAVCEIVPVWNASEITTVKPLLHAQHAVNSWDALQFVPGISDVLRFERAVSGESTFQLDCEIPDELTRERRLKAWVRWLGADAWDEYGPYSIELGYALFVHATGALVSTASVVGTFDSTTRVSGRQWLGVGFDGSRVLDGFFRYGEVRRNPVHREEILWRL